MNAMKLLILLLTMANLILAFRHAWKSLFVHRRSILNLSTKTLSLRLYMSNGDKKIADLTVLELKDVLREMNLPVGGSKSVLRERIEQARVGGADPGEDYTSSDYIDRNIVDSKRESRGEVYELESLLDVEEEEYGSNGGRNNNQKVTRNSSGRPSVTSFSLGDVGARDSTAIRPLSNNKKVPTSDSNSSYNKASKDDKAQGDLWFDDSVFDQAEDSSKGRERRETYAKRAFYGGGRDETSSRQNTPPLTRGEEIDATIISHGPLGASVLLYKKGEAPKTEGSSQDDQGNSQWNEEEEEEQWGSTMLYGEETAVGKGLILQQVRFNKIIVSQQN